MSLAVLGILSLTPTRAQQPHYDDRPKITVNGEALVTVAPDKIVVTFGIETCDLDVGVAKSKNNEILKKAVHAIKLLRVPNKDIQTDYLSVDPRYENYYKKDKFIGYFVRNTFVVTLVDPAKVETLVTDTLLAGVNHLHGIDFQTTDLKRHRRNARELALKAAREKATRMARVLGKTIGDPIRITENYSGSRRGYYGSWGFGRDTGHSQNVMQDFSNSSAEISETIALGKVSIRAGVTVTFELTDL